MPEKTVYSLTQAGRQRFYQLMAASAAAPTQPIFEFNTVIANLNKLPPPDAMRRIQDIRASMRETLRHIEHMQPQREAIPLVGRVIMQQRVDVLHALLCWLDGFEAEYRAEVMQNEEKGE